MTHKEMLTNALKHGMDCARFLQAEDYSTAMFNFMWASEAYGWWQGMQDTSKTGLSAVEEGRAGVASQLLTACQIVMADLMHYGELSELNQNVLLGAMDRARRLL